MTINDKFCYDCGETKHPSLFPKKGRLCYECKARRQRDRLRIQKRDEFNKLMQCLGPRPGIAKELGE